MAETEELAYAALDKLYSIEACAQRLGGVSIDSVRYWIRTKKLKPMRVASRVMVAERDVRRFLDDSNGARRKRKNRKAGQR
jgi:hypothetical protein